MHLILITNHQEQGKMEYNYCELPEEFDVCTAEKLNANNSQKLLNVINASPYCNLIECRKKESYELIIFDCETELPQFPVNEIYRKERLCIKIETEDKEIPEVWALRKTFPQNIPHLNLRNYENPKSLCIYDVAYDELKLKWTFNKFIEDIRSWLFRTAKCELHQRDQPLEPFMSENSGILFFSAGAWNHKELFTFKINTEEVNKNYFIATELVTPEIQNFAEKLETIYLKTEPQTHGVINKTPTNFFEIHELLNKVDLDFMDKLLNLLNNIKVTKNSNIKNKLIVLLQFQKKRDENDINFISEFFCFISEDSLEIIGEKLGLWVKIEDFYGGVVGNIITSEKLVSCKTNMLGAHLLFNSIIANNLNSDNSKGQINRFTLIGTGALGSNLFLNLTRAGYGKWHLFDDDIFLPHNLARHVLLQNDIARYKAVSLANLANDLLQEVDFAIPHIDNVLKKDSQAILESALNDSDLVLDMSASIAVERHLAVNCKKRILTAFLNPAGNSLVILSEDSKKHFPIDYIEMAYYRFITKNELLKDHLASNEIFDGVRYSTSCRDISSRLAQDNVALFSGICSKYIKHTVENIQNANATIWLLTNNFEIQKNEIPLSDVKIKEKDGWKVYFDKIFLQNLYDTRRQKLPKETCGILIGSFDTFNKKIYLVDLISAPKDSIEEIDGCIRGIKGLPQIIDDLDRKTASMLRYVGEWHSHPDDCKLNMSKWDEKQMEWIKKNMFQEGLPAIMLIVGDDDYNLIIKNNQ